MISLEEIKQYLPKNLSPESEQNLFEGLRDFPENIDERLYTASLSESEILYQGDGIEGLLFVRLPEKDIREVPSLILSNTCDINPDNPRYLSPNIVYAPILNLTKYESALLEQGIAPEDVEQHLVAVKKQRVTSIFFLPKRSSRETDSLVFLDRLACCDISYLKGKNIKDVRLFTLSQYGHYLFLFKLSLHFTRLNEGLDREMT